MGIVQEVWWRLTLNNGKTVGLETALILISSVGLGPVSPLTSLFFTWKGGVCLEDLGVI